MKLTRKDIKKAVRDKKWQSFRKSLNGLSTSSKLILLRQWEIKNHQSKRSLIQTTNYINALKRGGQL